MIIIEDVKAGGNLIVIHYGKEGELERCYSIRNICWVSLHRIADGNDTLQMTIMSVTGASTFQAKNDAELRRFHSKIKMWLREI